MSNVIEILKFSGPISLSDLRYRVSEPPEQLAAELEALGREGLVEIRGPLGNIVGEAFNPENEAGTTETFVELSNRGLRSVMA
jgi:hypothetical protein